MKAKSLKNSNPYLRKNSAHTRTARIRSIASSTAIETGETIAAIEKKLKTAKRFHPEVTLA